MFKSKKKKIICACCAMSMALQAQNLTVTGTVKSFKSDKPLQSANVVIENTNLGTFTDEDGRFTVKDIQSSEVSVKISMIGFVDTTLSVRTNEKTYDFAISSTFHDDAHYGLSNVYPLPERNFFVDFKYKF